MMFGVSDSGSVTDDTVEIVHEEQAAQILIRKFLYCTNQQQKVLLAWAIIHTDDLCLSLHNFFS